MGQYRVEPLKWRKKAGGGKAPYQGYFRPGNPEKYQGNLSNIMFRSGMELRLYKYLDQQPNVLQWSSEETVIPYFSPLDKKMHRYFMDAKATVKTKDGIERTHLIEVKPASQCKAPVAPKKVTKKNQARFLREQRTFIINTAKWAATETLCKKQGWTFTKLTEQHLRYSE